MSERMIEIQRAKLGLPPMVVPGTAAGGSAPSDLPSSGSAVVASAVQNANSPTPVAAAAARPTPQQAAAAAAINEDKQLQRFLHKLQGRNDNNMTEGEEGTGPTVPIAMSRRMLQRQGVGYLDETVAAVASASADRFLATVLQQAVACRDQRLKGAELAREEARQRRRHIQQYKDDTDNRRRRKDAREEAQRKSNYAAIAAAQALSRGEKPATASKPKKKKKKSDKKQAGRNGNKTSDLDDDDLSHDSLDEEEEYYEEFFDEEEEEGDVDTENDDEEEEDDTRYTLLLRDLTRPLEAWDFHLTGKLGVGAPPVASGDDVAAAEEQNEELTDGEVQPKDASGDGGDNPPSPSTSKVPAASPSGKGDSKATEPSDRVPAPNRTSTPAPNATLPSPISKPSKRQGEP